MVVRVTPISSSKTALQPKGASRSLQRRGTDMVTSVTGVAEMNRIVAPALIADVQPAMAASSSRDDRKLSLAALFDYGFLFALG